MIALICIFLVLFLALIVTALILGDRSYKRARDGITLIEQSNINPIQKLHLLMSWRYSSVSKERLQWLKQTIEKIEEEES